MKAIQFSAIDQVELIETKEPEILNSKDVKIKMINSGICSSDLAGLHGTNRRRKPPLISGHEAAGIVWEIGSDVTSGRPSYNRTPIQLRSLYFLPNRQV